MLTISGLTYRIGGHTLLNETSAQIPARSRGGLVGRNGAGKSTLLALIRGAAQRRDRGAAERYRRPYGAEPGGADPGRARARRGDAGTAAQRAVGRLAHAGGAGGGVVCRARSVAARRANQSSRPRGVAVART